jgi:hypothetical protein
MLFDFRQPAESGTDDRGLEMLTIAYDCDVLAS